MWGLDYCFLDYLVTEGKYVYESEDWVAEPCICSPLIKFHPNTIQFQFNKKSVKQRKKIPLIKRSHKIKNFSKKSVQWEFFWEIFHYSIAPSENYESN